MSKRHLKNLLNCKLLCILRKCLQVKEDKNSYNYKIVVKGCFVAVFQVYYLIHFIGDITTKTIVLSTGMEENFRSKLNWRLLTSVIKIILKS